MASKLKPASTVVFDHPDILVMVFVRHFRPSDDAAEVI
jgi:hypothetical protein